jgi:cell division protein ZapA
MKSENSGINVSILGKEFMVACPEGEKAALKAAARFVDERMREIQSSGKVIGIDRVAIMAALNIAGELLAQRGEGGLLPAQADERIVRLCERIDVALSQGA